MLKSVVIFLSGMVVILLGFFGYFFFTMTIGDTWDLLDKLEHVEGVVAVKSYSTYEGTASVTLVLENDGVLVLNRVGNSDLIESDGIIINKIGKFSIVCRDKANSISSNGVTLEEIQEQLSPYVQLNNIPSLVKNYKIVEELFSRMPLEIQSLTYPKGESDNSKWICDKA